MGKIDQTTSIANTPPQEGLVGIQPASIPSAQKAIQTSGEAGVNPPSLVGRIVSQINSEEVTIWVLFLLVVGVAAIFNPIIAGGIGFGFLAVYSACRVFKSEEPINTVDHEDIIEQIVDGDVVADIARDANQAMKEEVRLGSISLPQMISLDLVGRWCRERSITIQKGGQKVFDSISIRGSEEARTLVINFLSQDMKETEKKLRKLALLLPTQSVTSPFSAGFLQRFLCNAGLKVAARPGSSEGKLIQRFSGQDIRASAKVTISDDHLQVDEFTFEHIVPMTVKVEVAAQRLNCQGEFAKTKVVIRNMKLQFNEGGDITAEKMENYSIEQTLSRGKDVNTGEEEELFKLFRELGKTPLPP